MKVNRNQKSVLTLAIIAFVGLMLSGPANAFTIGAGVFFALLGVWFYLVRDKTKPQ